MISYGRQSINLDDVEAVASVLTSPFLTQGPQIGAFEKALCGYTGAKHCVVVANGTAALHAAVASLELPEGSEGITSPITFAASANSMLYCGVKATFADIDPDTFCLSPADTEQRATARTALVTPVHYAGRTCDMPAFSEIAKRRGWRIVEDAAHAIGSQYECGAMVGSCKYSDMTIFSFHPVKTITTGEGGAVTTNSDELYAKLMLYRSHGITKDPSLLSKNPGPWYYEMQKLGFNFRLTDFQAALGISQLKRIEDFKARRLEIVARYNRAFRDMPHFRTPLDRDNSRFCYHLYSARIDFDGMGKPRAKFMAELAARGIGTQVHYIPVHMLPYYADRFGSSLGDFPAAEAFYAQELSLPLYPDMLDSDVEQVIGAIVECMA